MNEYVIACIYGTDCFKQKKLRRGIGGPVYKVAITTRIKTEHIATGTSKVKQRPAVIANGGQASAVQKRPSTRMDAHSSPKPGCWRTTYDEKLVSERGGALVRKKLMQDRVQDE